MATLADLHRLALELPEVERRELEDGRFEHVVRGKVFIRHREPRRDAVDPATGERLVDVLMLRVPEEADKRRLLGDRRGAWFTTPHFDGYPAILVRIPALALLDVSELRDAVIDAWTCRAPRTLVRRWLAEHEPEA